MNANHLGVCTNNARIGLDFVQHSRKDWTKDALYQTQCWSIQKLRYVISSQSPTNITGQQQIHNASRQQLECGPMPNLMVALPNIGGALCSTPQSLADAHY